MSQPVYFSSTYELYDSLKLHPEAEIQINKRTINSRPLVSFRCTRHCPWINKKIKQAFFYAIYAWVQADLESGENGNFRNFLSECRCGILDRTQEDARSHYEFAVIKKILKKIKSEKKANIKLAVCGSGRLLSVELLLFRLIHKLRKKQEFAIELSLIDPVYHTLIEHAKYGTFDETLGGEKYARQFLEEMGQCLPKKISMEGTFFESAEHYIEAAQLNTAYRYDFLIGTNVDNCNKDFDHIEKQLQRKKEDTIALIRNEDFPPPTIFFNNLNKVYSIDGGGSSFIKLQIDRRIHIKLITAVAMIVLLGVAYFRGPEQ